MDSCNHCGKFTDERQMQPFKDLWVCNHCANELEAAEDDDKERVIKNLAPQSYCRRAHYELKMQMPLRDLEALLLADFVDGSYTHDECASFYIDVDWNNKNVPVIQVISSGNNLIYWVNRSGEQGFSTFNINEAINEYKKRYL